MDLFPSSFEKPTCILSSAASLSNSNSSRRRFASARRRSCSFRSPSRTAFCSRSALSISSCCCCSLSSSSRFWNSSSSNLLKVKVKTFMENYVFYISSEKGFMILTSMDPTSLYRGFSLITTQKILPVMGIKAGFLLQLTFNYVLLCLQIPDNLLVFLGLSFLG